MKGPDGKDAAAALGTVRVNTLTVYKDGVPVDQKANSGIEVTEDVNTVQTTVVSGGKDVDAPVSVKDQIVDCQRCSGQ